MTSSVTPSSASPAALATLAKTNQSNKDQIAATAQPPQRVQESGVSVTVSSLTRGLEKASRSSTADVNSQKVATVKAAIADGSYVVNAEAIADKMLSDNAELLDRTAS